MFFSDAFGETAKMRDVGGEYASPNVRPGLPKAEGVADMLDMIIPFGVEALSVGV